MKRLAMGAGAGLMVLWGWGLVVSAADDQSWWSIFLFLGCTVAVGTTLSVRVPHNPIGWLLLAAAAGFLLQLPVGALGTALLEQRPGVAGWLLWFGGDREDTWTWFPPLWVLLTQVLLVFPDGRLPSRGWRPFWWFTLAVGVFGSVVLSLVGTQVAPGLSSPAGALDNDDAVVGMALLAFLISVLGSGWSVLWRYRRASLEQREQTKWVALAVCAVVVAYGATLIGSSLLAPGVVDWSWVAWSYSLIPLSIGVAVLKYRLYDIDRIVSRTVSYAVVTSVVLGTYALVVTTVARFLPASESLAVAVATLSAAAAFRPLLARMQSRVDKRFNRSRYDAVLEVDAFADRLRGAVDPAAVAEDLVAVAGTALEPERVGVWLAGGR